MFTDNILPNCQVVVKNLTYRFMIRLNDSNHICLFEICYPLVVVRSEHCHSFIDSLDNQSTESGPASCRRRRPPRNAVSGHSPQMCLVV